MHVKDLLSLKGKIALITGGEGKFGRCMLEALVEADATVISASPFVDNAEKILGKYKEQGYDLHVKYVDQTDHEAVLKLKDEIKEQFGGLDILVNNAVALPMVGYEDPLDTWAESMRVNATGMFDIVREMADLMANSGGGSIVNIASMKGMYSPDFTVYEGTDMDASADYNFHKGGLISLTRYLARRLAPKNIRVNSISPGGLFANQHEKFLERYNKAVPLGRMANTDDIKGLLVLLASEASAYMTGENILIDGGLHA